MRERLARAVAVLTVAGLIGLSALFAQTQNADRAADPGSTETGPPRQTVVQQDPPVDTARARALFVEFGCGACHAVAGEGNPRNPLDGIGSRRTVASIRAWTIGDDAVADSLAPGILIVKSSYTHLPEADLELVVAWLAGLKDGG